MDRRRTIAAVVAAGAVLALTAGCDLEIDMTESTSKTFTVGDFDSVRLQHPFDATIVVGDETGVDVTINAELEDLLEVDVDDGQLVIGFGGGLTSSSGPMELTITTPTLTALDVGGAADVTVEGLAGPELVLAVGGAAEVTAEGQVDELTLTADGASSVDLDGLTISTATVDVGGASAVDMDDAANVSGSIGGASKLDLDDDATVDVITSGGAELD